MSIRPIERLDEVRTASELWRRVWGREGETPVPTDMLRALEHAGNYLGAAYDGEVMVGALLGFHGRDGGAPGGLHLHSHILGVDPRTRGRGVGFALKLDQRAWTLARGMARVEWTFDPLVRANGWFNLSKLAADGVDYMVDFYGPMPDAINTRGESDRVLVRWSLDAPAVADAAQGQARLLDAAALLDGGARVALEGDAGAAPLRHDGDAAVLLVQTPPDIVALRRANPALGHAWRLALRESLTGAMARGRRLRGMTRDGHYVVAAGD